jgi:hypothetical protein
MTASDGTIRERWGHVAFACLSALATVVRGALGLGAGGGLAGAIASLPDAPNGPGGGPGLFGLGSMFSGGGGGNGPDRDSGEGDDEGEDEGDWDDEALGRLEEDLTWHALKSVLPTPVSMGVDLVQLGPELGHSLTEAGKHNRRNRDALDLARRRE